MNMKTFIALLFCTGAAIAQMPQTITTSSMNSWPQTTTIFPQLGGGYNYAQTGNGPPQFGTVTATPGTTISAAVGPRGQIIPVINPTQPQAERIAPTYQPPAWPADDTDYTQVIAARPSARQPAAKQTTILTTNAPAFYAWAKATYGYERGQSITAEEKIKLMELYADHQKTAAQPLMELYPEDPKPAAQPVIPLPSKEQRIKDKNEFDNLFLKVTAQYRKQFWNDFYADWKVAKGIPVPTNYLLPYLKLWLRTHPESKQIDVAKIVADSVLKR